MTEFPIEPETTETVQTPPIEAIAPEDTSATAIKPLTEVDLEDVAEERGIFSRSFTRERMALTRGSFARPEGVRDFQSLMSEVELTNFPMEDWDISE